MTAQSIAVFPKGQPASGSLAPPLLRQPLLALLGVLVKEERQVADDEGEHDAREELGYVLQLGLQRVPRVHRDHGVRRCDRLGR